MTARRNRGSGRWPHSVVLWMAVAGVVAAAAEQPGSVGPPPAEHANAVAREQMTGRYLFLRYHMVERGKQRLAEEGIEDGRVEGALLVPEGELLWVRFVGRVDGELMLLHEVRFDSPESGELTTTGLPRPLDEEDRIQFLAKQTALAALPLRCADRYVAVLGSLAASGAGQRDIYLVPIPPTPSEIALGGWARVRVAQDGRTVLEAEALSKSCLILPEQEEAVLVAATHIVSPTPIAPHVFLSLQHQKPLSIATESGVWMVEGGAIGYAGELPDGECCEEEMVKAGLPTVAIPKPATWEPPEEEAGNLPPWRRDLVVWRSTDDYDTPWRDDTRLAGTFAEGYADDVAVLFPPEQGDNRAEVMWVRIIDYHPGTDQFLAILLNQPDYLIGVAKWDNVTFSIDPQMGRPIAYSRDGDYRARSLPDAVLEEGPLARLFEGVLHYRRGEKGQYLDEIEACVETLKPLVENSQALESPNDRYIAHYTLGRCLAESYETDAAIEQFTKALELRPEALDPNMALLAEYSVKVHEQDPAKPEPWWDTAFSDQVGKLRGQFGSHEPVAVLLASIFDEQLAEVGSGPLNELELERRRKVGFAAFRWKEP